MAGLSASLGIPTKSRNAVITRMTVRKRGYVWTRYHSATCGAEIRKRQTPRCPMATR